LSALSGRELLGRPVRWNGKRVGEVVDLLLDPRSERVLGLELSCEDGARRFLPLQAAELAADRISVTSPLALVDSSGLDFYRTRGTSLTVLAGAEVRVRGRGPGVLTDVLVDSAGNVESLLVRDARGSALVPPGQAELGARRTA
jgi:sporulation protein YlmC with PRC-barrel domain